VDQKWINELNRGEASLTHVLPSDREENADSERSLGMFQTPVPAPLTR
jgi:hypothetical protein